MCKEVYRGVVSDLNSIQVLDRGSGTGRGLVARRPFSSREPVVLEAPILVWGSDDSDPDDVARFNAKNATLLQDLLKGPSAERRRTSLMSVALKGRAVIKAWCDISTDLQRMVLGEMQTSCAETKAPVAFAVSATIRGLEPQHADEQHTWESVLMCAIVNAYEIKDDHEALFLLGCVIEHSCSPNVNFSTWTTPEGVSLGLFAAIRPIEVGEAICNSYLNDEALTWTAHWRRVLLYERHGFVCACKRCVQEGGPAAEWPRPVSVVKHWPENYNMAPSIPEELELDEMD